MGKTSGPKPFLNAFGASEPADIPPIWLMRQAGRYLPEYRAVREQAGGFLDLCYTPSFATEVTLQPIRRYGFDAAILFSDILVVPHALGQTVGFVEGEGPRLDPINDTAGLLRLDPAQTARRFDLVYEAIERIRGELPAETALIGFCGAPWTVATYMVAGRGTPDQADTRMWAYRDPAGFQQLIDILVSTSIEYLSGQVSAGAEALQIFDTWGGALPDLEFERWVVEPTVRIVAELNSRHPGVPVIGFPKGAGARIGEFAERTGVNGVGIDWGAGLKAARQQLKPVVVTQGNLDPLALVCGGRALDDAIDHVLETTRGTRHIFNLGHGIVPQTPPDHVAHLVARVRGDASRT